MTVAYLSLGSNLGDRLWYLTEAARRLDAGPVRLRRASSVYETAPQGKTDQPAFLNLVLEVETDLPPEALLAYIQEVEQALGRVRLERWGPRTVDIDIVLYGDRVEETEHLVIPHPRMAERAFVLVPLLELNPDLRWPGSGKPGAPVSEALAALPDQGVVLFLPSEAFQRLIREQGA